MKKFTNLLLLTLLFVCGSQWAKAQKVGMFIGYDNVDAIEDDDEKAAAEWFNTTYVATGKGKFYTPSTISSLNSNEVKALWVVVDRVGLKIGFANLPSVFVNSRSIGALQTYVKNGGNLLLTTQATQLVVAVGRVLDVYAPTIFGSGDGGQNPDVWGINAQIGCNPNLAEYYDHRSHPIYKDLEINSDLYTDHVIYPLIGNGWKEDHNCKWDFNAIAGLEDNPNKLADFENKTRSSVIGLWQHVTDYACAGVIEFLSTDEFKGTILCNGIAAYEWHQNDVANPYQSNIEKLTSNSLEYLKTLNTAASVAAPIKVDGVESYWGTFYSSAAKTLPEGIAAYVVEKADNGYAKLVKVAEGGEVIPGGEGFFLQSATAQEQVTLTTAVDADEAVKVSNNLLRGSDEETTFENEGTYYILGRTGTENDYTYGLYWQKGTEGKKVTNAANKAYLLIPLASESKSLTLTFGEATGIDQVQTSMENEKAETYNVAGQRIVTDYKGLVIKKGKKYLQK